MCDDTFVDVTELSGSTAICIKRQKWREVRCFARTVADYFRFAEPDKLTAM